jgi:hypothetical protein
MFASACSKKTIFRKAPPSVVSGYGKRSINLNKVVANFEKRSPEVKLFNNRDANCSTHD